MRRGGEKVYCNNSSYQIWSSQHLYHLNRIILYADNLFFVALRLVKKKN